MTGQQIRGMRRNDSIINSFLILAEILVRQDEGHTQVAPIITGGSDGLSSKDEVGRGTTNNLRTGYTTQPRECGTHKHAIRPKSVTSTQFTVTISSFGSLITIELVVLSPTMSHV